MAAVNFTPISLYHSTTAAAVPSSGNLVAGELALNTVDEKLYFKNSGGTVKLLASSAAAAGGVTSVAMSVPSFLSVAGSPITTTGTLAVTLSGTALPVVNGGTGQTTYTNGQLLIGNTTGNTLTKTTLTAGSGISITNGTGSITIAASGGGGDVFGPASATDTAIALFDTTSGKLLKNSLVTVSAAGAIVAPQAGSIIPFYFANQAAFPSAATYHGALAHSHADGAMFYAHSSSWVPLATKGQALAFSIIFGL